MFNNEMNFKDEDMLQLSGLQHFAFCRRQWALIHIEKLWHENWHTTAGELMHTRAHNETLRERRGNVLTLRSLSVVSRKLGISGQCDIVEFTTDSDGISLIGEDGLWKPYPVEYKRGSPKTHDADKLQLCAQAMCLEEMLCCYIEKGALFYGETKRRTEVLLDQNLRNTVTTMLAEMHELYNRGYTPKVRPTKSCNSCSLKDFCLPALMKVKDPIIYLRQAAED